MIFEKWDWIPILLKDPHGQTELNLVQIYIDWKAEREKHLAQIAEQDREIAGLLAYVDGNDKDAEIDELETRTKKAEAERDGYINQIKAVDNIIETYGVDGSLPHDRVFKLINRFEARITELGQELLWAADACEKAESLLAEKGQKNV